MSVKNDLKKVWNVISTMNDSIESHNRTIADILESLERLSALTTKLADLVTSLKDE